ncbi:MAG: hypothetical protein ACHQQS_12500 [Thermoanaerobaculales bacterium]
MKVAGYQPRNSWLHRQLDQRWHRWVSWCLAGAAVVSAVMAGFVAPRQATLRMRYEIARLTTEVEKLEGAQRQLLLEREALTSPAALAAELPSLGLTPVTRDRVVHLTAAGELVGITAKPTPASRRSRAVAEAP